MSTFSLQVPVLLFLSIATLCAGVYLPIIEITNLALFGSSYSIVEAAWQLWDANEYLLSLVVFVSSVVFPMGKIVAAALVWLRFRAGHSSGARWIGWLEFLGRWSCADVLLVAIVIVVTKSAGIADANTAIGIWFFSASIVLTAVAVWRVRRNLVQGPETC